MSLSERPLVRSERQLLKGYSTADQKRYIYLSFAGMTFMLFTACFVALGLLWDLVSWFFQLSNFKELNFILFGVSAVTSLFVTGRYMLQELQDITSSGGISRMADADLRAGLAIVERLEVLEVVEIAEEDDEGAGFLLSLRDGRVLFLMGQELYPYSLSADPEGGLDSDIGIFPSDKIEFTYAPVSGVVLSIKGDGQHLKPRSLLSWQGGNGPHSKPYRGPIPDQFTDGPLEDVIVRAGLVEEAI